jgi:hypothetical protein
MGSARSKMGKAFGAAVEDDIADFLSMLKIGLPVE